MHLQIHAEHRESKARGKLPQKENKRKLRARDKEENEGEYGGLIKFSTCADMIHNFKNFKNQSTMNYPPKWGIEFLKIVLSRCQKFPCILYNCAQTDLTRK